MPKDKETTKYSAFFDSHVKVIGTDAKGIKKIKAMLKQKLENEDTKKCP
jgi:hypothetical protein|tara:strand:+ start:1531 stop:1677 length:147 start_codon:yes stop_codon:yes gene_type:complete